VAALKPTATPLGRMAMGYSINASTHWFGIGKVDYKIPTGKVWLCLWSSWREGLRVTITKKCSATHRAPGHAGSTVLWEEHGNNFTTTTCKIFFLCGCVTCLWYVEIAAHGCLCFQTFSWLPCPPAQLLHTLLPSANGKPRSPSPIYPDRWRAWRHGPAQ